MIHTIGDLLRDLLAMEVKALKRYGDLGHGPMIGDMYEGLSRKALDAVVFQGFDLRVVEGKIRFGNGSLSSQKDVLLVMGEGEQVPHTEHFVYPMASVLAVIEVKKTLYGGQLEESFEGLFDVKRAAGDSKVCLRRALRAYKVLVQKEPPTSREDAEALAFEDHLLLGVCLKEATLPIRVVLGYDGYRTEAGLRNGLIKYLEGVVREGPRRGYGPVSFPSLIMTSAAGLVKLNGMPYVVHHNGALDEWMFYASVGRDDVHRTFLEVLWTRLASEFGIGPEIFGEDLKGETLWPLLYAKPQRKDQIDGWEYRDARNEFPREPDADLASWRPVVVTDANLGGILNYLVTTGSIDTRTDAVYLEFREQSPEAAERLVEELRVAGIAAITDGRWNLLTDQCQVVILPSGEIAIGENHTGRLTRWVQARMTERRPG